MDDIDLRAALAELERITQEIDAAEAELVEAQTRADHDKVRQLADDIAAKRREHIELMFIHALLLWRSSRRKIDRAHYGEERAREQLIRQVQEFGDSRIPVDTAYPRALKAAQRILLTSADSGISVDGFVSRVVEEVRQEGKGHLPVAPNRSEGGPGGRPWLAAVGIGSFCLLGVVAFTRFPEAPDGWSRAGFPTLYYLLLVGVAFFSATTLMLASIKSVSGIEALMLLLLVLLFASAALVYLAESAPDAVSPEEEIVLIVIDGPGRVAIGPNECRARGPLVTREDLGRGLASHVECRIRLGPGAHSVQFDPDTGMTAHVNCQGLRYFEATSCELPAWNRTVRVRFVPEHLDVE